MCGGMRAVAKSGDMISCGFQKRWIKYALSILAVITVHFSWDVFSGMAVHADENKGAERVYPEIELSVLREQLEAGLPVENALIQASDLIEIISSSSWDIVINDCLISGTLDFRSLKKIPVESINFPRTWSDKAQVEWVELQRKRGIAMVHQVDNRLRIENTRIKVVDTEPVIKTGPVFFQKKVSFIKVIFEGDSSFAGAFFGGEAEFLGVIFKDEIDFFRADFSKETIFKNAVFEEDATFTDVRFGDSVDFRHAKFFALAVFQEVKFDGKAKFHKSLFKGECHFVEAKFKQDAIFNEVTMDGLAYFGSAEFNGNANFWTSVFGGDVFFNGAKFFQKADFNRSEFKKNLNASKAEFIRIAYFLSARFKGDAQFTKANFWGKADFEDARFEGDAQFTKVYSWDETDFYKVRFMQKAFFNYATFLGVMNIKETSFKRLASFKGVRSLDQMRLAQTMFYDYADFRKAEIENFEFINNKTPCLISGRLDFRDATIGKARFKDIFFLEDINFSKAKFGKLPNKTETEESGHSGSGLLNNSEQELPKTVSATFDTVTFNADATFVGTIFYGICKFEKVTFTEDAVFTNADFQDHEDKTQSALVLNHTRFNNLIIRWDQLPDLKNREKEEKEEDKELEGMSQILGKLLTQFRNRKQLQDANKAYYEMKYQTVMEARLKSKGSSDELAKLWMEIEWLSWGLFFGYGTKLFRALATISVFWIIFASVYFTKGEFKPGPGSKPTGDGGFLLKGFVSPGLYLSDLPSEKNVDPAVAGIRKLVWACFFSLAVLFKLKTFKVTLSGSLGPIDLKHIVMAEWALGHVFIVALILTLKNTSPLFSTIIALL